MVYVAELGTLSPRTGKALRCPVSVARFIDMLKHLGHVQGIGGFWHQVFPGNSLQHFEPTQVSAENAWGSSSTAARGIWASDVAEGESPIVLLALGMLLQSVAHE